MNEGRLKLKVVAKNHRVKHQAPICYRRKNILTPYKNTSKSAVKLVENIRNRKILALYLDLSFPCTKTLQKSTVIQPFLKQRGKDSSFFEQTCGSTVEENLKISAEVFKPAIRNIAK